MPTVRTIQSIPISLPGIAVATYGTTANALPLGISRDTKSVFGATSAGQTAASTVLYESTDDCSTWAAVHTFPEAVQGFLETDDGEALVATQGNIASTGTPGNLYKSTGWATSHSAATWTKVLTTTGGYIRGYWSATTAWSFGDDTIAAGTSRIGLAAEYGGQTTGSGDQTAKARRVYLTQDYGATWTPILDLYTRYGSGTVTNMHVHWAGYDPYWKRIWVLIGDNPLAEGYANYPIIYSDDLGATWTAVPAVAPNIDPANGYFQSTTAAFLPDSILFGHDVAPGLMRINRAAYRTIGTIQQTAYPAGHSTNSFIAAGMHQNRRQQGAPVLAGLLSQNTYCPGAIYGSVDGGATMLKLWQDDLSTNTVLVSNVYGPTFNGKIVAAIQNGGSYYQFVGELITPDPNQKPGQGVVTGDGTTTVFNFAHGLGYTPARFTAWQEAACGAYTVTATATNIVLTFTAAPANGANIPIQWRAI